MAPLRSYVHRRGTILRRLVRIGTSLEERSDDLDMDFLRSYEHRRDAIQHCLVRVGTSIEERPGDLDMATLRSNV